MARPGEEDCGPDFQHDDPRYAGLLKNKKKRLLDAGYPPDAIALLDRHGACVAAIERAPDVVNIKVIASDGATTTMEWTPDEERIAIEELKLGKAKRFYRMISARRFACCHEVEAENQPDWDAADEVNAGVVIKCEWKNGKLQCK